MNDWHTYRNGNRGSLGIWNGYVHVNAGGQAVIGNVRPVTNPAADDESRSEEE